MSIDRDVVLDDVIREKQEVMRRGTSYARFEPPGDDQITHEQALEGINKIRNSIVGLQTINWSEHIFPLVALLNRAGIEGLEYPEARANYGTCIDQRDEAMKLLKEITKNWRGDKALKVKAFLRRCGEDD